MVLPPSDAGRDVDGLAVDDGYDCFLDVVADALDAAETLRLALADQRVDRLDLDREEAFDRFLDLALGGIDGDVERDLAVLGGECRLLRHDRRADDVVVRKLAHANRASSASTAALVRTSRLRRRMSATLMAWMGRTSICGMLRAARAKFWSSWAPSTISALFQFKLPNWARRPAVLASLAASVSTIDSSPALALAESACFSAKARTFLGRSISWLRTTGPKALPPPRNCGARRLP